MTDKITLPPELQASLADDLIQVAQILNDLSVLISDLKSESPTEPLVTACQKAGFMIDRWAARFGQVPVHGTLEAWMGLAEEDDETVQSAA